VFFPKVDNLMADIFDEIDEDLKRDHMQLLWARYGKIVIAVVLAIVLLVAVRQGYTAWQTSRAEVSASAYQHALQSNNVVGALESQLGQLSAGYKMLAQFQIAAEHATSGDFVAAEAGYLRLASDGSVDPLYQQAATLLSVMVAPRDVDVSSLEARLSNLETAAGPWQAMALETGAGLALRNGNKDTAVLKYKRIMEMGDVPVGLRQRAQRMIVILND
jgi:hypothetical protein